MSDTVYIYGLIDVRNKNIFYVGSTSNILRRYNRYIRHIPHSPALRKAIGEMKRTGRLPVMKVLAKTDLFCRNQVERYWIRKLYMEGQPLVNTTCIRNWKGLEYEDKE